MEEMAASGDKITIIGSGLGGLLAGYLLSKEGVDVVLLEKQPKFGGSLQTFHRDGFSFDTGMHYLGSMSPGQPLHRYWSYFGLTGHLDMLRMDPEGFDRISLEGSSERDNELEFPLAQGFDHFKKRLLPFFPDAGPVLDSYIRQLDEIALSHPLYNLTLPVGPFPDPFASMPASSWLTSMSSGIRHQLSDIPLAGILAGNNFLYAGNPATTPLSQFALINHSFISSAWRLAGGSRQITDLLVKGIRANGGRVFAGKKVTEITKGHGRFQLTTADGDQVDSDRVISSIHPASTLKLIRGIPVPKAYGQRIESLKNTTSVFSVYLGLKPESFPYLNYHVYHHVDPILWADTGSRIPDVQLNSQHLETGNRDPGWPRQFLFMTPPEKNQGTFACTAVVMSPMHFGALKPWENSRSEARESGYSTFKSERAKQLLGLVYRRFPKLKDAIATIGVSTPLTWRDYTGTPEGSMYGIIRNASHPEKTTVYPKTKIPGLFFTGQSTNLHGALGVTIGAVMTCGEILGLPYVMEKIIGKSPL